MCPGDIRHTDAIKTTIFWLGFVSWAVTINFLAFLRALVLHLSRCLALIRGKAHPLTAFCENRPSGNLR